MQIAARELSLPRIVIYGAKPYLGGTMMPIMTASRRHSDFGLTCAQCGDLLIAPEGAEYENERHVHNLWACTKCGCRFETEAYVPAGAESASDDVAISAFSPSLLVA
jgi:ribosomal protein L37AE/L43A